MKLACILLCGSLLIGSTFSIEPEVIKIPKATKIVKHKQTVVSRGEEKEFIGEFIVSAYCSGIKTASGKAVKEGMIAAPTNIPFGTKIMIDDKVYIVEDRTNKRFDGKRFDIYMGDGNEDECFEWGIPKKKIYIIK